jgi:hypothetical protein
MNKIFQIVSLAILPFLMVSCWTSIWTVAPTDEVVVPVKTVYSTTVTTPAPKHTTVTTMTVTNYNTDLSFYLDLNAVAAAFAESRSVKEFEQLLNSSRYMINNLDLNRDGWIDYLRVIETHRGTYHTLLIQACLAPAVYQDVATLVAEHRPTALYVEVIGDRWLYGPNYIVRPVFVKRPPLWDVFGRPSYVAWTSPYYYDYWPNYYVKPKPIYLNHYQAYVKTYMTNHHYCHHCDCPTQPFYSGYTQMTQGHTHHDYAQQHPNDSFEQRVTHQLTANGSGVTVRNAGQLRTETQRQAAGAVNAPATNTGSTATTRSSSATSGTSSRSSSATSGTSSRQQATTATKSTATTRVPSTTVESRVNRSGTIRTTIKSTDASGRTTTVRRESSSATRSSSPSTRTSAASSSNTRSSAAPSTSTRTSTTPSSNTRSSSTTRTPAGSGATRR